MASYFIHFERITSLLNIDNASWATRLGSLLLGMLADVYISLPEDITANYNKLQNSLLMCFQHTPNHYRSIFCSSRKSPVETYQQFSTHFGRLFDHWYDSTGTGRTFPELRSFVILNYFLASLPPELCMFLKENHVQTLQDTVSKVDVWAAAHNSYPKTYTKCNKKLPPGNKIASPCASPPTNRKPPSMDSEFPPSYVTLVVPAWSSLKTPYLMPTYQTTRLFQ